MIVKGLVTPWYIFSSKAGPLDVGKNLCCGVLLFVIQSSRFYSPFCQLGGTLYLVLDSHQARTLQDRRRE